VGKKKITKRSAKATLADVAREMAKPRVATSARSLHSRSKKTISGEWRSTGPTSESCGTKSDYLGVLPDNEAAAPLRCDE